MVTGGEGAPALALRERGGLVWYEAAGEGWRLVLSTRAGGVSPPPYDTLNIGYSVADAPANVAENRARLCAAAGLDVRDLVVPGQVHETAIAEVGAAERGRGHDGPAGVIPATDGLLTREPGVPVMVSFADCVPVFLAAREAGGSPAIALVHAGWRGMLAGIVREAALRLRRNGATLSAAVIGPSIGPCCFTVSADVREAFAREFGAAVVGDGVVDLWSAAVAQLTAAGLAEHAIRAPRLCTSCDARFFSHRRDHGLTGRQAAIAWVTGGGRGPSTTSEG